MGTLSFDMKLPNMRKAQDFIVYPASEKTDFIMIQSSTRFGKINMTTGMGLMSQSHANGAYAVHMHIDKLVKFQLTDSQLEKLKEELAKTAGSAVGRSVVISDNSYADKFAEGGEFNDTFSNVFLSFGFTPKRSFAGYKFFVKMKSVKGMDYFATVDLANKSVIIEDEKSKLIYQGFSVASLIQALKNYGFEETGKFAKGGYVEEGEDYEYVNTFKRFDSNVPVPQEDFEKFVDAYHKKLSGDMLDVVKYNNLKRNMGNYLGHKTMDEMEAYIDKTHKSHEHYAKGGIFEVGDLVMVDDSGYAKAFSGFDTTKPAKIISKDKKKVFGKIKYFYGLEMADGRKPFNDAQESMLTKIAEKGAMFGAGHFAEGGAMAKRSAIVGANIDESDLGDLQKRGITIKKLNEMLTSKFPYSFGFKLYPVKDPRGIIPNTDDYYGVQDKELLLSFDRHHGLNYRVVQGDENTYFYFLLDGSDGKNYIGHFGFKDRGDVGNDYVTSFVAFLHKAYNQPFNVAHEVYAKGGVMSKEQNYKRRLGYIQQDVKMVLKNSPEKYLKTPVEGYESIETLLSNIEIASDINDNESDNWSFAKGGKIDYYGRQSLYNEYLKDVDADFKKNFVMPKTKKEFDEQQSKYVYRPSNIDNFNYEKDQKLAKDKRSYNAMVEDRLYSDLYEAEQKGDMQRYNTLLQLRKDLNMFAKGGMFGAGHFASGGELVDKTIDHDGKYLHLVGNHRMLHIHLNNEGREMIMDERESGRSDEEIMYDLFEDIVGNSTLMYHTDLGESGFGMTSSSGVTYDYGYDDNGDLVPLDDNAVVYVDNDSYRRSPVEELLEGRLIMRNSDFMARGGKLAGAGQFAKGGRSGKKHTMNGIVGTMENDDHSESVTIYGYDSHWNSFNPTAQEMKKTKQLLNEDTKILDDSGVKYKVDYEEGTNLPTITIKSISGKPATIESLKKVVSIKEELM
jgi:hypothetical protein